MERSVITYAKHGYSFTQSVSDCCRIILQDLPVLGESGSEVSYFIPQFRNFYEVAILSDDIKKPWIKATQKGIKNLINNKTFLVQDPEKGEPVTPCMDVYKAKIQSDGNLDHFKLSIVVRGDLQNKDLVE